jgi:predicted ATP-dependent serine protease
VTEICGLPGTGRTTLCLRYASHHKALWIDTEGCLCPPEGLALCLIRIHDHLQLFALHYRLRAILDQIAPELIVIDSIAAPMRGEVSNETPTRTALLCDFGNYLKQVAADRGIAVLVTNHMSKLPFHGFVRTLGGAWGQIPTHCFETKTSGTGDRVLRVRKSPSLARTEISFSRGEPL